MAGCLGGEVAWNDRDHELVDLIVVGTVPSSPSILVTDDTPTAALLVVDIHLDIGGIAWEAGG